MKKICIIVLFLLSVMNLSAQLVSYLSGSYAFQLPGNKNDRFKDRTCAISFYKDNTYEMDVSFLTGYSFGAGAGFLLSVGTYELTKNDTLILKDLFNNFTMTFNIKGNIISPVKTFGYCNKKQFVKEKPSPYTTYDKLSFNPNRWLETVNNEKKLFLKNREINRLQSGIYRDFCIYRNEFFDYNINIREDKTFQVTMQNIPILKGTWERKGNELLLCDTTLRHNFWLLIDKDRLMGNLFVSSTIKKYFYLKGVKVPVELCQDGE